MTWPLGWDVRHVDETGSTNADLIAAVMAGTASDRTVLAADHQTAGRGRLDRRWDAPPGANLLVSIVVAPVPAVPAEATHRVGVAAVAAVRRFVGADVAPDVGLKWPNDVLVGDRKLAGILAQRVPDHDAVVVGLGLNVGWAPEGAAAIGPLDANQDDPIDPPRLLRALLEEIDALPNDIAARYVESLVTIGRRVRVEMPAGADPLYGRAVGVDAAGRLLVADAAGRATSWTSATSCT
jgi:BirA family transcriptional regulator, biotin operon repressor / biotin---[acetyl-CoA-carboxylase] ligase